MIYRKNKKAVTSDIEILEELTFPELILEFNENNLFLQN